MFVNHLKIAFRHLIRSKGFSFINVSGLAIGMACCVLILLFVRDEVKYDGFHENADRLHRITSHLGEANGNLHVAITVLPLAKALKQEIPEISSASAFGEGRDIVKSGESSFVEFVQYADEDFFTMFSFPFLHGDPNTALSTPNSIVITESAASKHFGRIDVLGETISLKNHGELNISGIIKDTDHSHITLNLVLPLQSLEKRGVNMDNWSSINYSSYVLLNGQADREVVAAKILNFLDRGDPENTTTLHMQALTDIYLHSSYAYDIRTTTGSARQVYLLFIVAISILLIACINFMNLTTARSEKRLRETGLRKILGAKKRQLAIQFIAEAVFFALLALLVSLVLVKLALPFCNELFQRELTFNPLADQQLALGLIGLSILTGLVSGFYPAIAFTRSHPLASVSRSLSGAAGHTWLRKTLVVTQFACSIVLIISTMVIYQQLRHFQNSSLGYDQNHLVILNNQEVGKNYQAFRNEVLANSNVLSVTGSSNIPTWSWPGATISEWEGNHQEREFMLNSLIVNHEYFKTYDMELVQGRSFSPELTTDMESALVVNEEAVRQLGMAEPLGKQLTMNQSEGKIIGVVKDFHFDNLRNEVNPLVIRLDNAEADHVTIRIAAENANATMAYLEETALAFSGDTPVQLNFLDASLARLYRTERTIGKASLYFSILAVLIASLGLFGLASFSTERRTREIGVRKVLGATVPNILLLISKEFTVLVFVAFVIASPVAYLGLESWLQNFANRIDIGAGVFLAAGAIAVLVTFATIGYQSVKAALQNPATALQSE